MGRGWHEIVIIKKFINLKSVDFGTLRSIVTFSYRWYEREWFVIIKTSIITITILVPNSRFRGY